MKRILFALAILTALPAIDADANFTGRWVGSGGATFAPGNNVDCQQLNFQFDQGFRFFEILRGEAFCGMNQFNFPVGTLTVENGVLKDRGIAVGMIGPDYFHISYSFRPGTLNILDVRMSGRGVLSVVHTAADNQRGTTEIRGNLTGGAQPF